MPNPIPWERIRLAAPSDDGTLLARPKLAETAGLLHRNVDRLDQIDCQLQGRSFQTLRQQARDAVIESAVRYTELLRGESVADISSNSLVVSGHQPALFHPGVWAKNFAIANVASQSGGRALNLVVDNDTLNTTRVRIPDGGPEKPQLATIAFDTDRSPIPWEDARIEDAAGFANFGDRVSKSMGHWGIKPLVAQGWPAAQRIARQTNSLRDSLTAARHSIERDWGLDNLELPLSQMCSHESFLWFAAHLLVNLPSFTAVHNEVLDEYRLVNRVRSQTHPVPPLANETDWIEAPFWVWTEGESQRRRVFAKQTTRTLKLSDGETEFCELPCNPDMDACCAVEVLRELESSGIRFRTRALTTTLYARLMLADIFVHGIGGAKYDEMTDRIIHRFYGIVPPAFQVISATVRLPFTKPIEIAQNQREQLIRQLRDLRYNPRSVPGVDLANIERLMSEKQILIAAEQSKQERPFDHAANYDRYLRLRQISFEVQKHTASQQADVSQQLDDLRHAVATNTLIQSREFSFSLFPEATLRPFLTKVLTG